MVGWNFFPLLAKVCELMISMISQYQVLMPTWKTSPIKRQVWMLYEMLCFRNGYVLVSGGSVFTLDETLGMAGLQDLDWLKYI